MLFHNVVEVRMVPWRTSIYYRFDSVINSAIDISVSMPIPTIGSSDNDTQRCQPTIDMYAKTNNY